MLGDNPYTPGPKQTRSNANQTPSTYLPARTLCYSQYGLVTKSSSLVDLQQEIEICFTKTRSLGESVNWRGFNLPGRQVFIVTITFDNEITLSLTDSNCHSKGDLPNHIIANIKPIWKLTRLEKVGDKIENKSLRARARNFEETRREGTRPLSPRKHREQRSQTANSANFIDLYKLILLERNLQTFDIRDLTTRNAILFTSVCHSGDDPINPGELSPIWVFLAFWTCHEVSS